MKGNVGGYDRWLRIVVGVIIVSFTIVGPQSVWGWVGVIPMLTGFLGYCPVYTLFGINTCPVDN